jgi:hypothetical protein
MFLFLFVLFCNLQLCKVTGQLETRSSMPNIEEEKIIKWSNLAQNADEDSHMK